MPLMGSLYVGSSGLQTSQNALNTTAHNLSNIDTKGYTRQQVLQGSRRYNIISYNMSAVSNQEVGLGVSFSKVRQVRDSFLDQTYRKESGRSMFYETSANSLEEVEVILGEFHGEAFATSMENFWTSIQELAKDPSSVVTQGVFVQRAASFLERASSVYEQLYSYQDNMNDQIMQNVNRINKIGEQINALNEQITAIECGGVETPNDLRDVRNQLLDELSKLADISYTEELNGSVFVQLEGTDFVKSGHVYKIEVQTDKATGFHTPFWPQNASYKTLADGTREYNIDGAKVFNLNREISSDLDTDIGGLKAMLLARGDHRADYTEINSPNYDKTSQSIIMNIQAEFDQLIHNVVTKVNSILADSGYMKDTNGAPLQLFVKSTTPGYTKDATGNWVYNPEDPTQVDSLYSLKNIQINKELLQNPGKLGFINGEDKVDYETAEKLKKAFTEEAYTLNPNVKKKTNFIDYYSDLVAQVANSGSIYRNISANQQATVESTFNAREQIIGVSSDEELSNMIRFQNAYNASSRYINVISEMLEHIISTLAV